MSTTQRVGVAVVALGLMGLGVFLVLGKSDEPQPTSPPAKVPVLAVPTTPATTPSEGTTAAPPSPVVVAPATATPEPAGAGGGTPQVEYAPSPFESSNSAELQYATKLVIGEETGPGEWRKAVEVFQRCLDQNPMNHFCKRGVYAAWERIDSDGGMPTTTLTAQPFQMPRPVRGPRADGIQAPGLRFQGQ